MIVCPNCGGENADESVHCGHCGHQLTEGGKKTMFGMAALDMNQIRAAADAARQQSAAPSGPLNLPKPGGGALGDGPSGLNLPRPGGLPQPQASASADAFAKTEMMPSVSATAATDVKPAAPAPDPFADEFAALEAQYGADPDLQVPSVDPTPTPQDFATAQAPAAQSAPSPSFSAPAPAPSPGFSASPAPAPTPAPAPSSGFGPAPTPQGPTSFGAGPTPQAPQGFGGPGQSLQQAPGQALQAKDNKKTLMIVGIVVAVLFLGCVVVSGLVAASKFMN